jgi:hypothetical protein
LVLDTSHCAVGGAKIQTEGSVGCELDFSKTGAVHSSVSTDSDLDVTYRRDGTAALCILQ